MEPTQSTRRAKRHGSADDTAKSAALTVGLDKEIATRLDGLMQKSGGSRKAYASAAIKYFLDRGLDPLQEDTLLDGLKTRQQLQAANLEIRKFTAEVGNRIVAIQRSFERELFKFLQAEHGATINYLAQIEENILAYLVATEARVLTPLLENVVKASVETHVVRILTEVVLLKDKQGKYTKAELDESMADYDQQLGRRQVKVLREVMENSRVTAPKSTQRPPAPTPLADALRKAEAAAAAQATAAKST